MDYESHERYGKWLRDRLRERYGKHWRRHVPPVVTPYRSHDRIRSEEEVREFLERVEQKVRELDRPKRKRRKR